MNGDEQPAENMSTQLVFSNILSPNPDIENETLSHPVIASTCKVRGNLDLKRGDCFGTLAMTISKSGFELSNIVDNLSSW